MKIFTRNFAAILKQRGLTQMQAADVLGISQSLVSAYVLGLHTPTRRTAEHLAARLGLTADVLLHGEVTKTAAGKPVTHRRVKYDYARRAQLPYDAAMKDLKRRWKRIPGQRDQIMLAVRVLFPRHLNEVVVWFNKP